MIERRTVVDFITACDLYEDHVYGVPFAGARGALFE